MAIDDCATWTPAAIVPSWTVRLPEDATAPSIARAALREWLVDAETRVRHAACSVASELVAHAVRQGAPPFELLAVQRGERVRIEVADGGDPTGRRPPGCWSQQIVGGLGVRWGVRGDDAHVWFELPLR